MGYEVSSLCCTERVFTCVCTAGFYLSVEWGASGESRPDRGFQKQPALEITEGNTSCHWTFYDPKEDDNMKDWLRFLGTK